LIDFGIAKIIRSDEAMTPPTSTAESRIETINYMSPEAILDAGSGSERTADENWTGF
jgi:serine/threonine protein kinase